MESTAFSTKIALSIDMQAALRPRRHQLFRIFTDPHLRPPILEEMMTDLQRVVASLAQRYHDPVNPSLNFDELVAEGNLKLAELITKDKLIALGNRFDFFRYFKSAVHNHTRSRLQRFCYTEKRTGQKPPPRSERFLLKPAPAEGDEPEREYHKNVDLSLDDPELGLQVADAGHDSAKEEGEIKWGFATKVTEEEEINWDYGENAEEYAQFLTKIEKLVYKELIFPSAHARCFAELEARRKPNHAKLAIKVKFSHMAEAVGLSPELFEEAVLFIRNKIKAYRMLTGEQQDSAARRSAIIAQLKQVFGLQIPSDIDDIVVRRMLTMAARDQFDKLNSQINEMLMEIGAKVPRIINDGKLACYGVLYQKNCRPCNMCDLRHSCAVEAANTGLTKMVQSPRLLGSRQPRIPAFLPRTTIQDAAPISSSDEAEIITHLDETYQRGERSGFPCYYHYVGDDKKRRIIFVIERTAPLQIRFCNPSEALRSKLTGKQKTWFPHEGASVAEIYALIDQHGKETFL
jgi:hypothetical protein